MEKDGYIVLSPEQGLTIDYLPEGYIFMDYTYALLGPPLFTYHRDVTSSKTVFKTKYPTYTMIQYEYDGNFLSVAPGSHASWTWGLPITLSGKKGTRILFDCDLLHGGVDCPGGVDRMAVQYKIIHEEDLPLLKHLEGTDIRKKGTTVSSFTQWWMRITSYLFAVPIQWMFLPLLDRWHNGGLFGLLQRLVPINHYNNYGGKD